MEEVVRIRMSLGVSAWYYDRLTYQSLLDILCLSIYFLVYSLTLLFVLFYRKNTSNLDCPYFQEEGQR